MSEAWTTNPRGLHVDAGRSGAGRHEHDAVEFFELTTMDGPIDSSLYSHTKEVTK